MPYLSSSQSYDASLNPTKAAISKHKCAGRPWFGFGPLRCECGERWGVLGCESRIPEFLAYLQDSNEAERADDLQRHADLFTTFEAEMIEANDWRSRARREKAAEGRRAREREDAEFAAIWQDAYPEPAKPAFWHSLAPSGTHEIIRLDAPATASVPHLRQPLPYTGVSA